MDRNRRIKELRRQGESYGSIAKALGISVNTIKSYCQRNGLGELQAKPEIHDLCTNCNKALVHTPGSKKKKFCNKSCRMAWWAKYPDAVNKKAIYRFTCLTCNKKFESYGNGNRKYCSRTCFGIARRVLND